MAKNIDGIYVLAEAMEMVEVVDKENPIPNLFVPSVAGAWRSLAYRLLDLIRREAQQIYIVKDTRFTNEKIDSLLRPGGVTFEPLEEWQPIETAPKDAWFIGRDENKVFPCRFDGAQNLFVGVVDFVFVHGVLPQQWTELPK